LARRTKIEMLLEDTDRIGCDRDSSTESWETGLKRLGKRAYLEALAGRLFLEKSDGTLIQLQVARLKKGGV
jgi:hypothetical protein